MGAPTAPPTNALSNGLFRLFNIALVYQRAAVSPLPFVLTFCSYSRRAHAKPANGSNTITLHFTERETTASLPPEDSVRVRV